MDPSPMAGLGADGPADAEPNQFERVRAQIGRCEQARLGRVRAPVPLRGVERPRAPVWFVSLHVGGAVATGWVVVQPAAVCPGATDT